MLQTESATVGEVLSGKTVESLPLNGRNTSQLALLLPGAVTPNPGGQTTIRGAGARPYVNGNREQTNNFMVDGVEINDTMDNRVGYQPSPDALAEISVETNNYAADIGNVAGGVISNVIKSGANQFRGNVFEFYRNSDFDANTWERNRSSAARAERKQHIFGAHPGRPDRQEQAVLLRELPGHRPRRAGHADGVGGARRPGAVATSRASPRRSATRARACPFPGNQIPLSRISPIARAILSEPRLSRCPTAPSPGSRATTWANSLSTTRAHQGDLRLDWNASANDKVFLRFSIAELRRRRPTSRPSPLLLPTRSESPFRNLAVNWNRVFGPSVINELLVGYNSVLFFSELNDWAGIGDANAEFGIAGGQPIAGLSNIQWGAGLTNIGAVATVEDSLPKIYQLNEKLTWLKGRHALKFGGQFLRYDTKRFYPGNNGLLGLFNYTGTFTGNSFSDFLLDQVALKGRGFDGEPWTHLQNRISLFVQDDFKLRSEPDPEPRPALGLHLARWWRRTTGSRTSTSRRARRSSPRTAASRTARSTSPTTRASSPAWASPGARATAWSCAGPTASRSTWKARAPTCACRSTRRSSSSRTSATTRRRAPGTITTGFTGLVARDQVSGQPRAWDPNLRPQFTQQWNLFAEYRLTSRMSAQVGYVGHHATQPGHARSRATSRCRARATPRPGRRSTRRRPLFAALPLVTNISTTASRGRSDYKALQASVRQRDWKGLEFLASYTFGKIQTNNLGYYGSAGVATEGAYWVNAYDPEANYGLAFHDVAPQLRASPPTTSCRSARARRGAATGPA